MILVTMANKQLSPKEMVSQSKTKSGSVIRSKMMDENESLLSDTNGYMYITFLQTILAFLMQDAPEALTQVKFLCIHRKIQFLFSIFTSTNTWQTLTQS